MTAEETLAAVAAVVASTGGVARMATAPRVRVAGLAALLAGWVGLVVAVAPAHVLHRWYAVIVALAVAAAVAWWASRWLLGRERWLLCAGAAVLALRVPVPTGGDTSSLLVPLYVVVGFGALTLLRRELAGLRESRPSDDHAAPRAWPTLLLDLGAPALPALATLSLLWSIDRSASTQSLAFFLVPFLLVYSLVRAWTRSDRDLAPAGWALVAAAALAAVVGLVQTVAHRVWWNPKVIDANRFRADFRTNSLFWDPNIYGRLLVIAALVVIAWLVAARPHGGRAARFGIGALVTGALLLAALWFTYSQSSFFALSAACVVIGVLTLPVRARVPVGVVLLVIVVATLPVAGRHLAGSDATGRSTVAHTGLRLLRERPVAGWGVGTFGTAATEYDAQHHERGLLTASHTTPVTVLAELGIVGSALYLLLLAAAVAAIAVRWGRATRNSSEAADARAGWPPASVVWATGAFVALVAHSLLYAGFFEDASLWAALALLAGLPVPSRGVTVAAREPAPLDPA